MKYIALAVAAVLICVCAGVVFALAPWAAHKPQSSSVTVASSTQPSLLRQTIANFGKTLKDVSLSAPDAGAQITATYATFVAPQLLAEWQANPTLAIGEETSSPWPNYIDITSVTQTDSTTVTVNGRVVEVTNGDDGVVPAATYPVTMTLVKQGGAWLITSLDKGAYMTLPAPTTLTGTWGCLPTQDASSTQTTQCALGFKDSDGYYAVDTGLASTTQSIDFATGQTVSVTGTVTPVAKLTGVQKYDIQGLIRVITIKKI